MDKRLSEQRLSRRRLVQAGGIAALPVFGIGLTHGVIAQTASPVASPGATPVASVVNGDWPTFGYDYPQTRHVPYDQVTKNNVSELGVAWAVDFMKLDESIPPANQSFPIIIDGVMYVTTTFSHVYALDAKTGKVLWSWKPEQIGFFKNFGVFSNRGVAVGGGSVFVLTLDMHLYKIDQKTGKLQKQIQIWDVVQDATPEMGYYESSAPIYYKGNLYFGHGGSDNGVRGWFMALKADDLTPAWPGPFYTIPPDGQDWRKDGANHGGGAPWMPGTLDPETDTLYFVTGNPSPDFFGKVRPGNNPNVNSMVALDAMSGHQKWVKQSIARDLWDYDMAAPPVLFEAEIGGKKRKVVAEGSKAGQWWCWDAATGEEIYGQVVFSKQSHPDPTVQGVLAYPGVLGGSNYAPQSFDPTTNYYLICNIINPFVYSTADPATVERRAKGDVDYGGTAVLPENANSYGSYVAIDLSNGAIAYNVPTPGILRSGFTTTATGLGFYGGTTYKDSNIHAIDTETGMNLWSFGVGNDVQSAPSIYVIDGEQYVGVVVGGTGSKVMAFKLGGDKTQVPAPPKAEASTLTRPRDPSQFLKLDPKRKSSVIFNCVGGYTDVNSGMNFNGWSKGDATLTVPTNWFFTLNFWSQGSMPHSAILSTADEVKLSNGYKPAFPGAQTPNPIIGITGNKVQHFSLVEGGLLLSVAGKYVMLCGVPGHTPAGMWFNVVVDDSAKTPSIKMPDGKVIEAK